MMKKNKSNYPPERRISLSELIDIKKWQKIQDVFAEITGIGLRTIDLKGANLTSPSGIPKLCSEILSKPHPRRSICEKCLPTFLGGEATVDRNLSFTCPPGFRNFVVPLNLADGKTLGYVILGPVILVALKPKEQYLKIAEDLNIDPQTFYDAVLEVRVLSFYRLQTIVELVKDVGAYILNLAYNDMTMKEEIETTLSSKEQSRLPELLDKFLNVAIQISGADIGSIMMMDTQSNELTILASRGLPEQVIRNARVRYGEGISGIAVKENTPFLIDETNADERIKTYLNRPQIKSSMVLPIKIYDMVMGVMNLGALVSSPVRFNQDNLKSMNDLINLATLALRTTTKNNN